MGDDFVLNAIETYSHVATNGCQDGCAQGWDIESWREQVAPEPVADEYDLCSTLTGRCHRHIMQLSQICRKRRFGLVCCMMLLARNSSSKRLHRREDSIDDQTTAIPFWRISSPGEVKRRMGGNGPAGRVPRLLDTADAGP